MGVALARDVRGRVSGGVLNTSGANQYTAHRVVMNNRIDAALVKALDDKPFCVQDFVDSVCLALSNAFDPEAQKVLALALPRMWPAILQIERSDGDLLAAQSGGADEWSGLSAEFGTRLPSLADIATGNVLDVEPIESSDTSAGTE